MAHPYRLDGEQAVASPALIFYPRVIRANIARILALAGSPQRLRPHVKTHKTLEITKLQLACGIVKHKCATIAEAETLATAGAEDVLLAYPVIGPTAPRLAALARKFPHVHFAANVDGFASLDGLRRAAAAAGRPLGAYLDLDVGQHRTGIAVGPEALDLARRLSKLADVTFHGIHAYDGHNHQDDAAERSAAVDQVMRDVLAFRESLQAEGIACLTIVAGGTPNFPLVAARRDVPGLECSPGTYVLHDRGYGSRFPDLDGVTPAAVLLTRVVSKPGGRRITFDLGTKAVASDSPQAKRVYFPDIADAVIVAHNEEHLVIETPNAASLNVGDVHYALPWHICPTVALHAEALIADDGNRITERWRILARDRTITV